MSLEGSYIPDYRATQLSKELKHYEVYKLDLDPLLTISRDQSEQIFLQFELGKNHSWPMELSKLDFKTEDFKLRVATPNGQKILPPGNTSFYNGFPANSGEEASQITFDDEVMIGSIKINGKQYFIEPVSRFNPKEAGNYFVVYEGKDVIAPHGKSCGSAVQDKAAARSIFKNDVGDIPINSTDCRQVEIALAADYSMYEKYNDIYELATHMLTILCLSQANFDDEFDRPLQFKVSEVFYCQLSGIAILGLHRQMPLSYSIVSRIGAIWMDLKMRITIWLLSGPTVS